MYCRWMWRRRRCPSSYFGLGEGKHPGPGMVSQRRLMDSPNGPSRKRSTFSAGSFCPPSHSKTTHTHWVTLAWLTLIAMLSWCRCLKYLTHTGNPWHLDVVMTFLYRILSEEQEHVVIFTVLAVSACLNETYGDDGRFWNQTVKNMKSQGTKILQGQLWTEEECMIYYSGVKLPHETVHCTLCWIILLPYEYLTHNSSLPFNQECFISVLRGFSPCLWNASSVPRKLEEVAEYKMFPVEQKETLVCHYCYHNYKLSFIVPDCQVFYSQIFIWGERPWQNRNKVLRNL